VFCCADRVAFPKPAAVSFRTQLILEHNSSFLDDTFMTIQIMLSLKAMVSAAQQVREEIDATTR
jgi:hypothetical protein